MGKRISLAIILVFLAELAFFSCAREKKQPEAATITSRSYEDLVTVFKEFREFLKPQVTEGVPDYTVAAMNKQKLGLEKFRSRLDAIDYSSWPVTQQIDYHIVRAEINGLEFDHRVIRPWSRDPCFYTVINSSEPDVAAREGPELYGTIALWTLKFPLSGKDAAELRIKLQAVPRILEQAKINLTEEAKDLWYFGIQVKKRESTILANLATRLAADHPGLASDAEKAKAAVDEFRDWLEKKQSTMTARSGVGIKNYNWYMKNVHLTPYTWQDQLVILERELERGWAFLTLEEQRNRKLPKLELPKSAEEYQHRSNDAKNYFFKFLKEEEIFTLPDYMLSAFDRGRGERPSSPRLPTGPLDLFNQIGYRDPLPTRSHGTQAFDKLRMLNEPHPSPIRRVPLLYNIWDSRAEGLPNAFEEMMMHAGLLDQSSPRAREFIYMVLINRTLRAIIDLKMHSNEFTPEDAVSFACQRTPRGWLLKESELLQTNMRICLHQPGYCASFVIGKIQIDKLIADRSRQLGEDFSLKKFLDELHAAGMIPVSLIRWEMTGLDDEINQLTKVVQK